MYKPDPVLSRLSTCLAFWRMLQPMPQFHHRDRKTPNNPMLPWKPGRNHMLHRILAPYWQRLLDRQGSFHLDHCRKTLQTYRQRHAYEAFQPQLKQCRLL